MVMDFWISNSLLSKSWVHFISFPKLYVLPRLERSPRLVCHPEKFDHLLQDYFNSAPSYRSTSYNTFPWLVRPPTNENIASLIVPNTVVVRSRSNRGSTVFGGRLVNFKAKKNPSHYWKFKKCSCIFHLILVSATFISQWYLE